MTARFVTAPNHVGACDLGPATVLVNYRAGTVHTLYGPAARWWAELTSVGDSTATSVLDSKSADGLLNQLLTDGLLTLANRPTPWPAPQLGHPIVPSWGTQESQAGRKAAAAVPRHILIVGAAALALVLLVQHGGRQSQRLLRLMRLVEWFSRRARRAATPGHAGDAIHAVRRAGLFTPGRVACLEESVAAVVTLAVFGRGVSWCHGVAADPIRLHAWVETENGHEVAEPESTQRCTALRTVPDRRRS